MIRLEGLVKNYSGQTKIGPLDLEIPKAGITSIIGQNGAGKSTTLLMIGRLLEIDAGRAEVAGLDVAKTDTDVLAKELAILRQENSFVTRLTVRQLISFGRFPYSKGRLTEEDEEIVNRYIDFLELSKLADRYLDQLSGGQRQRAYLAMVLCQETDYVLLDEPLNNLDVARSKRMLKLLRKTADELKRTIVMVMHDINFAAQYSDYICAMRDGKIIHFGKSEETMRPEILSDIFSTDIDIISCDRGLYAVY